MERSLRCQISTGVCHFLPGRGRCECGRGRCGGCRCRCRQSELHGPRRRDGADGARHALKTPSVTVEGQEAVDARFERRVVHRFAVGVERPAGERVRRRPAPGRLLPAEPFQRALVDDVARRQPDG